MSHQIGFQTHKYVTSPGFETAAALDMEGRGGEC